MPAPARVHDLTALLETHMPVWATAPLPVFEPIALVPRDGYSVERIQCTTHTGTHLDAPFHFFEDGISVDRIPTSQLVGSAAVLDVRADLDGNRIPRSALERHWPSGFSPQVALLRTDWSRARSSTKRYLYEFPGIDPDGAEWLVQRGLLGVGTDTLGIDPYTNSDFAAHKVLLRNGLWILEALDHLDELRENVAYTLVAAPLKIAGASGAMARVLALEP